MGTPRPDRSIYSSHPTNDAIALGFTFSGVFMHLSSAERLVRKGFQLENNHGSPQACSLHLIKFLSCFYGSVPLSILDVGGGNGLVHTWLSTLIDAEGAASSK